MGGCTMTRILLVLVALALLAGCCPDCPPQVVHILPVDPCPQPAAPKHIPLPDDPKWDPETANAVLHNAMADKTYRDAARSCLEHYERQMNATQGAGDE